MNRSEYLAAVGDALDFMEGEARAEVITDMAELYDGLASRGMSDDEVQTRIGTPAAVAAEYRLSEALDRVDRSPGGASSLRIGFATLTGRLARGAAFQLLGLVWFALALVGLGAGLCIVAGLVFAVGTAAGFDPFVTTLAVPSIPAISGVFMGLAVTAGALALLLANRLVMRALARAMRKTLGRRRAPAGEGQTAEAYDRRSRRRWINSGRAAWQTTAAALVIALISAGLMLVVEAPEYPLSVNRSVALNLDGIDRLEIWDVNVDVRLVEGDEASARLTAEMKRTFGQVVDLQVTDGAAGCEPGAAAPATTSAEPAPGGGPPTTMVTAVYHEGLSWGINPRPLLIVTVPRDSVAEIVVIPGRGEIDLTALGTDLRELVRVEP